MWSIPVTALASEPEDAQPTLPSLLNQEPSDLGPKRYRPGGMSNARLQSVTRHNRSLPFIRHAKFKSSGDKCIPSAITSVLTSGLDNTYSSMLPCIGNPSRLRTDDTSLIAHQKWSTCRMPFSNAAFISFQLALECPQVTRHPCLVAWR